MTAKSYHKTVHTTKVQLRQDFIHQILINESSFYTSVTAEHLSRTQTTETVLEQLQVEDSDGLNPYMTQLISVSL